MNIGKSIGLELGQSTRFAFGEELAALGDAFPTLVVVDGDVGNSTRTEVFGKKYPERFFNAGIAESNMVSMAAGLALSGHISVASSFAAFLTCNAYDQIRMGVGFPHANVKLVGSHCGISIGEDGPSQMGIEDLALMSSIPQMVVLAPADGTSTRALTRKMLEYVGPVYMRTGRPDVPVIYKDGAQALETGKAHRVRDGKDATIIACGLMVAIALEAASELAKKGVECRVLDMHTVKPVDRAAVIAAARETGAIVTVEEHTVYGGLGGAVAEVVVTAHPVPMRMVGVPGVFAPTGSAPWLLEHFGLTAAGVREAALELVQARQA